MDIALRAAPTGGRVIALARIVTTLLKGPARVFAPGRFDILSDRQLRDVGLREGPYDGGQARESLHWRAPMM